MSFRFRGWRPNRGSAVITTWYWFSCVYSVLICRWPKASYSVLSTMAGVIPSRPAVSRSITRVTFLPPFCRSLATSRSCGICCRRATILGTHSASSAASVSSIVYWYCVRLTRSSTLRSCTGCMYSVIPSTADELVLQPADHVRRRRAPSASRPAPG